MGFVVKRGNRWHARYKDTTGTWKERATKARTKSEAKKIVADLERANERQHLGLEPLSPLNGGGTFGELTSWWIDTYLAKSPSYKRAIGTVQKHIVNSELATVPVSAIESSTIEVFLQAKVDACTPATLNHIRAYIGRVFSAARRAGKWPRLNPVLGVPKRKVPKRIHDYLRADEVPRVIAALAPKWRPLFATAIYTGCRRGELFGMRKSDVDIDNMLITVARSYERDTTKGGHADVLPIAAELVPYLRTAIEASRSDLLFPDEDGRMRPDTLQLQHVLRRALHRAGIVTAWVHKCRRKGCGHSEDHAESTQRWCPRCGFKLWPSGRVRPIRFHHLRHTTASLLMMAGADIAAVQRILRHSDPRITTEVYGHLAPNYLRKEIDRLKFGGEVTPRI
jgi:integrase